MVDFEKLNKILEQQKEFKEMKFIDIDSLESVKMIKHFKEHNGWFRRSSSGQNYHVIMNESEVCNTCDELNDSKYDGEFLFNNKGKKWADTVWVNLQTKETRTFIPTLIAHIFNPIKVIHYYCELTDLLALFRSINESELEICYYTFHSVIAKRQVRFEEKGSVSGDEDNPHYEKTFDEYLESFNFKKWKGKETFHIIMNQFKESIPQ